MHKASITFLMSMEYFMLKHVKICPTQVIRLAVLQILLGRYNDKKFTVIV